MWDYGCHVAELGVMIRGQTDNGNQHYGGYEFKMVLKALLDDEITMVVMKSPYQDLSNVLLPTENSC